MSRFLLLNFQDFGLDHHITKTIQSHTLFCICCLVKNVPFLNLSNCIHGKYLEDFPKPDLRSFKEVICYQCHATLKRIEVFRQQVADSFNILKDEAYKINEIENIKKLNFEMHNAVNIYLPPVMKSLLDNPTSKEPVKNPPTVNIKKERESTEVKESEYTEVPIKIEASTVETLRENEMNEVEEIRNECIIKIEQEFDDIKLVPMESVNECDDQMTISDTELRAQTVKTKMKSIKSSKIKSIKLTKEELANERLEIAKSVSFLKNPHRCERCLIGFRYKENMMDHLQRKHEQMSTQSDDGKAFKRDYRGRYIVNDEQMQWLEDDGEFSDCDDSIEDPYYLPRDGHEELYEKNDLSSDSEFDSDDEQFLSALDSKNQDSPNYIGKNGFLWSKTEIAKTRTHNINVSRPTEELAFRSYEELWSKIFDSEMIEAILLHTNKKLQVYRQQFRVTNRLELKDTNEVELRSLFGLLYCSSVLKCNDEDDLFSTDGTGHEIFRCVMSKNRFCTLLSCLRFDDGDDRQERFKSDPLAAISWLFDKFLSNSQQKYILGANVCIEETLLAFRGRCKFVMYMPNTAKYGIKVFVLSDAETHYIYNAYIYCSKGSDDGLSAEKLETPTQSVLRLVKPIENSNRNITADNWCSSIQLMQLLKNKKLTYLGKIKKNKREIPPEFLPNKRREPGSTLYGFTKDFTMLSHVPKKNKAVILISSSHHSKTSDDATKTPNMIIDYNQSKVQIDKQFSIYSCSRKTRRWTMAIFYRILDLAGINAFVLYQNCPSAKLRRGDFLLNMARELVLPSLKDRVYNDRLPRELRLTITRVLSKDLPPKPEAELAAPGLAGRKLCSICPSKLKRQTRYRCWACKKHICLQCAAQLCQDCQLNY